MGVAALHIESGQRVEVNGNKRFPMASTAKLAIALYCLSLVDRGVLSLRQKVLITPQDVRLHRGCYRLLAHHSYSIKRLIKLSIEVSDNAAPDKLLKIIGGPEAVTAWLRQQGIGAMSVDRSIFRLLADFAGVEIGDAAHCTDRHYQRCLNCVTKKDRLRAHKKFFDDVRDTASPRAMADLLANLQQGNLVSKSSTDFLLGCMLRCRWGENRIKHFLPRMTKLWHKTGRIDGIDSDVGIIELPHGKGHVALAVYSNRSTTGEAKREEAMACVARAVFKFFA
jgi:beta-lactamase class A